MADVSPWLLLNPVRPLAAHANAVSGAERTLSPEPKEVAITTGGETYIIYPLAAGTAIDTVFLGFTSALPAGSLQAWSERDGREAVYLGPLDPVFRPGQTRGHALIHLATPVASDRLVLVNQRAGAIPAGVQLGVVAAGRAFRTTLGQEYGNGRGVIDTGTATRRRDGGFGFVRGARASSWKWTLGDLTAAEVEALEDLLLDLGETRTALVVEDVAAAATNPRGVHWSRFARIEPFERRSPRQTRWSLQIEDWS